MIHKNRDILLRVLLALYSYDAGRDKLASSFGLDRRKSFLLQQHRIPPTEHTILRIADMTGVSYEWLMTGHPSAERDFILDRYIPHPAPDELPTISGSSVIKAGTADRIVVNVKNGS